MNKRLKEQEQDPIDYMKKTLKKQVEPIVEEVFNRIESLVNLSNGKLTHVEIFTEIYDTITSQFNLTNLSNQQLKSIKDLCYMADVFKGTIRKENSSLASYLAKRLTVSIKEAQLIENAIKEYSKIKNIRY